MESPKQFFKKQAKLCNWAEQLEKSGYTLESYEPFTLSKPVINLEGKLIVFSVSNRDRSNHKRCASTSMLLLKVGGWQTAYQYQSLGVFWVPVNRLDLLDILANECKQIASYEELQSWLWHLPRDLMRSRLSKPRLEALALVDQLLEDGPRFDTLKKAKKPLDPEEREQAMKAGAVWNMGPKGEPCCGIWKAEVKGKTWYVCHTHRCYQAKPTLKGAIKAFEFVKTTA